MMTRAFHVQRVERMLRDLGIDAASLIPTADFAILDDAARRRLTPPLGNQTLVEGLVSAVKIVASDLKEGRK